MKLTGSVNDLRYQEAQPYPHVVLSGLCEEARARALEEEAKTRLRADYKETDLFKVYQTGDLAGLDIESHPNLVALRDAIYAPDFRRFVSELAGCGPLIERTDCSANVYTDGGHLLCHDDVIGTRRVSYIIYLTHPDEPWTEADGGALELYPLEKEGEIGVPSTIPCKSILPAFNQMVLFTVVPGVSFHAVQEVTASANPRLSISGWFHGEAPLPSPPLPCLPLLPV